MNFEKQKDLDMRLASFGLDFHEPSKLKRIQADQILEEGMGIDSLEFIQALINVLKSWDQMKACPCSDHVGNFVVRSKALYTHIHFM